MQLVWKKMLTKHCAYYTTCVCKLSIGYGGVSNVHQHTWGALCFTRQSRKQLPLVRHQGTNLTYILSLLNTHIWFKNIFSSLLYKVKFWIRPMPAASLQIRCYQLNYDPHSVVIEWVSIVSVSSGQCLTRCQSKEYDNFVLLKHCKKPLIIRNYWCKLMQMNRACFLVMVIGQIWKAGEKETSVIVK